MTVPKPFVFALRTCAFAALLSGCGASAVPPPTGTSRAQIATQRSSDFHPAVDKGIYATEWYGVNVTGYSINNRRNKPPICSVRHVRPADVAVDGKGNLLVPNVLGAGYGTVQILKGPGMCGPVVGSVSDPYGSPTDVAAGADATTGTFIIGNWTGPEGDGAGSVSVCTFKGGCTANIVGIVQYVGAVALGKNGDCWDSGQDVLYHADLVYHRGCAKSSRRAKGFLNRSDGGLDIDNLGHLVSISSSDAKLYVYSGCSPDCVLAGGPFNLRGHPFFGHLNASSTRLAVGSSGPNEVDVYSYSPSSVRFLYRFSTGLPSGSVSGATYNPRSNR
ncbi:MAG: hypothetical protein JO351_04580 [Candidatus Eremiobacteraeota bacterium]|nr:hypothetical protein [Candidatus Eremiobacteraeota bacterium]